MLLQKNAVVEDHVLKHQKLVFELKIVANATPASKSHSSDLPGVCLLATEGKLTDISGVEAISGLTNYTAPSDSNGIFDVMLKGAELGTVKKVMKIQAHSKGAAGLTACTVQVLGDNFGLTAGGNIAFEVDSAINFATTNETVVCEVDFLLSE